MKIGSCKPLILCSTAPIFRAEDTCESSDYLAAYTDLLHHPETVQNMTTQIVGKILGIFGLGDVGLKRWGEN
jgi:hypothetical protein